jgi:enoyl-CoA hydratase/carnithine racemase
MSDVLLQDQIDNVRVLTLNRPAARNALSSALIKEFYAALRAAQADANVRVLVITGADPAFCAGLDLKEAARDGAAYFGLFEDTDCINLVGHLSKPAIAAVNGAAFTGGLEIALGCDILLASQRAVFADTHARVGVLPGGGMTARLPRLVGPSWARRMSLTGEVIDAKTAERIGLVTEAVPHEQLLERTLAMARAMTEVPETISSAVRSMYVESAAASLGEALAIERRIARSGQLDFDLIEERRVAVTARNRSQLS